jgi:hypothetical protein
MLENIILFGFIAILGYGLYKIIFKNETPTESVAEIKKEAIGEVKKVEEVAKVEETKVEAVVAKVEEVAKTEETKVEAVVAKVVEKKVANKATRNKKTST